MIVQGLLSVRRAWLALALALAACGPHADVDCSSTIPCAAGLECSASGVCEIVLPADARVDAPAVPDAGDLDASIDAGPARCGDNECTGDETCVGCPADCGDCPFSCGDGACSEERGETCALCPLDCGDCPGACGDTRCAPDESCETCPADCGACPGGCGDGACGDTESCASCPSDCGPCPGRCGDMSCGAGESCASCPSDCGPCPGRCGDLLCDATENCMGCPSDCGPCGGRCGDMLCDSTESCASCPLDCGTCPGACAHDPCLAGGPLDAACSDCVRAVCDTDPFCCGSTWDDVCVNQASIVCGTMCDSCGDGACRAGEGCATCPTDCGPCPGRCGDLLCDATENCMSCPSDCGPCPGGCGDFVCEPGESCASCPSDCGPCPDVCGDMRCGFGESCTSCPADCGTCADCVDVDLGSTEPVRTTGTTDGAGFDVGGASCGGGGDAAPELVFRYVAPVTGSYRIDTFGSSFDTLLYVRSGDCGGRELACNDDDSGTDSRVRINLTAGEVVVIVVDGWASSSGIFALNIRLRGGMGGCGDGACSATETCTSCPDDCGACPCAHDLCDAGTPLEPTCDFCVEQVCAWDPFCCTSAWDGRCVGAAVGMCFIMCARP